MLDGRTERRIVYVWVLVKMTVMQIGQELLNPQQFGSAAHFSWLASDGNSRVIAHNWPARFLNINKNQIKVTSQFSAIVNKLIGSHCFIQNSQTEQFKREQWGLDLSFLVWLQMESGTQS